MSENWFFLPPMKYPLGVGRHQLGRELDLNNSSLENHEKCEKCISEMSHPIFPCKQDIYWKLNGHLEIWNKHGIPACQCSVEIRMYRFELSTTCTGKTVSGHLYAGSSTPWAETRATWPKLEYSTLTQRAPKNGSKWGATCILGPSRSPCSSMLP